MNLHAMTRQAIRTVNPDIVATLRVSTGYTQDASYKSIPTYNDSRALIQVQGLTEGDLKVVNGLNLEGVMRSVYMNGNWQGIVRVTQKGGDLIKFPLSGSTIVRTWKIVQVMESWPDWTRVIVMLQDD
jgi:hypothetical protein